MKHDNDIGPIIIAAIVAAVVGVSLFVGWLWRRLARWARRRRKRREMLEIIFSMLLFIAISLFIIVLTNQ